MTDEIEFEIRNSGDEARMRVFLPRLEEWFGNEMADLYDGRSNPTPNRLLMAGAVWGEKYLTRFDRYGLATILGNSNLHALAGYATMLLYTDKASHAKLITRMKSIEAMGIEFEAKVIPDYVMDLWSDHPINKLWMLGIVHQAGVHIAGRRGMDFHMLLPDHLVASDYYANLFRVGRKHDGIAQNGISANIDSAKADIERFRDPNGFLSIPDRDLGNIGWNHLHKQTQGALIGPCRELPASHHILWQGWNRLYHLNCRMNAAWLSNKACRTAPTRIPATMDASIPYFMPPKPYFPTAEDGLTFVEISDDDKYHAPHRLPSWSQYVACAWSTMNFEADYLPYCRALGETPISPQNAYLKEAEIHRQHAVVVNRLEGSLTAAAIGFARAMAKGHA